MVVIQIDAHKSEQVLEFSESLYKKTLALGFEVLLDDRDKKTSPGVKFAESELIGIPHRIVVSPRSLADGAIEYTKRSNGEKQLIDKDAVLEFIVKSINTI